MKKLLSCFLLLFMLSCLVACSGFEGLQGGSGCDACKDENSDHQCDVCKTQLSVCKDDDYDHLCDLCKSELTVCKNENGDNKCDICGSYMEGEQCASHTDANHDLKCDSCGVVVECTAHVDVRPRDQKCDYCKAAVPCEHELDEDGYCYHCEYIECRKHVDRDHDLICDHEFCYEEVECTTHADADENGACDWCEIPFVCPLDAHADVNRDGLCDACLLDISAYDFPWSSGTLTFEMTDQSNYQELPSGCKNWMAGEAAGIASLTIAAAQIRNEAASKLTKLTVKYEYLPDNDPAYSWSKNYTRIYDNQAKGLYSDMYCNFVYDMMGASLLGCFANLNTADCDNYFEFAGDDDYGTTVGDANGYMYDYMTSLSIAENRMYLLASDYFIDLIRAYYCVPVNVAMLNDLGDKDVLGLGRDNTVTDFADAVLEGKWTYELLLKYCAWFKDSSVSSPQKGFAIAQHSLSSAGLLYTSSVRLFTDERKVEGNSFIPDGTNSPYSYVDSNETLYAFAEALEAMVKSTGVVRFTKSDNTGLGSNLLAIREQFTSHRVLFGGVILLGSLEYQNYQEMKTGDGEGFLVVPVPLYTDYNIETGDVYSTQIHNVGRIGAISSMTNKFAECSAFLNYQSTHSASVRNAYYNYDLLYSVVGGDSAEILEANKDMLQLMRDSIISGFDKAYEDASALFSPDERVDTPDGVKTFITLKWHDIMDQGGYLRANTIRTYYSQLKNAKEACMRRLFANTYPWLPD